MRLKFPIRLMARPSTAPLKRRRCGNGEGPTGLSQAMKHHLTRLRLNRQLCRVGDLCLVQVNDTSHLQLGYHTSLKHTGCVRRPLLNGVYFTDPSPRNKCRISPSTECFIPRHQIGFFTSTALQKKPYSRLLIITSRGTSSEVICFQIRVLLAKMGHPK